MDPAGRLHAVEDRHRHVHDDHVGMELAREAHRFAAVSGLGHHRHPGVFEGAPDRLAQELMIVCEQDSHQGLPWILTLFSARRWPLGLM